MTDLIAALSSADRCPIPASGAMTLFDGPGDMRAQCRDLDWASTALGPVTGWSRSLRTTVGILLASRQPMVLFWGPDLVQFFNDAYRPSLGAGGRADHALGAQGRAFWTDVWDAIGPQIEQVMTTGEATWHEDQYLPIERNGGLEDVWWTYSYGPVRDDDDRIAAVLVVCQETTSRVESERAIAAANAEVHAQSVTLQLQALELRSTTESLADRTDAAESAAAAWAQSEARYRALFDAVDAGLAVIEMVQDADGRDVDFRYRDVNPAFVSQSGLIDAVGRTARELVPDLEMHWVDTYSRVARTGEATRFERGSDVMGRWFTVYAFRTGAASERRVAIFFHDVTAAKAAAQERERLLAALAVEQVRLEAVFAQAPSFLAVLRGPDNVFELVNAAYEQIIGHGRDVVGKPLFEAMPETRGQGFDAFMAQVRTTGEPLVFRDFPVMLERERGAALEERFVDITYQPLVEADGTREAVVAHGTDVTEQVRARRALESAEIAAQQAIVQLRAFADAIPTLAWTARPDGYITWYNARWYEYTGMTPADMEGWGWQQVHDPVHLPAVLDRWRGSIATGQPFEMTFPLRDADGTFRSFLSRIVPARDASGTVTGWFGTNTDVEVEIQLRRTAEEANRAKSEFLAVMSHELRTPLNAIDGYAELMELGIRGPISDEQRTDLARIRKSQRHLLGLINGVLNYAQVEAGAANYEMEFVSVDEVLVTCEAFTMPQARTRGLVLHRQPCDPALTVRADREKLQQVVLNLISNAIKFTDRGGQIALSCARTGADPHDTVEIKVVDTGIGIAAHQLSRVFEPFVQVNTELTRTRDGTGLGLAISRDLARGMGGDLTAESELGRGSTFTVTLPSV